jgi:dihydroorotase
LEITINLKKEVDKMEYDILIKNGTLIDPYSKIFSKSDIGIKNNRIVSVSDEICEQAKLVIQANDYLVMPGLIDFHTHAFYGGTDIGVKPDVAFLPAGVTTVVDAGSAGTANYGAFSSTIIANSIVRIKAYLNVCSAGLVTTKYHENVSPMYYDQKKMAAIIDKYRPEILGLKIRISKEIVGNEGLEPLKQTLSLAEEFDLPIVVHTTNPPAASSEIAKLLRAGDVFAHVYQGTGQNIINHDGKVYDEIKIARERGVIFDAANGGNHWVFDIARSAMADGFYPDVISTDITTKTQCKPPIYGLPYIMSKYLNMGMDLPSVVTACTSKPAQMMNLEGAIGTLNPGAFADVAIFKLIHRPTIFADTKGQTMLGEKLLIPQVTIKDGQVVYSSMEFDS